MALAAIYRHPELVKLSRASQLQDLLEVMKNLWPPFQLLSSKLRPFNLLLHFDSWLWLRSGIAGRSSSYQKVVGVLTWAKYFRATRNFEVQNLRTLIFFSNFWKFLNFPNHIYLTNSSESLDSSSQFNVRMNIECCRSILGGRQDLPDTPPRPSRRPLTLVTPVSGVGSVWRFHDGLHGPSILKTWSSTRPAFRADPRKEGSGFESRRRPISEDLYLALFV